MTTLEDITTVTQELNLPDWAVKIILTLILLKLLNIDIVKYVWNAICILKSKVDYLDGNKRRFINSRNNFIEHLQSEIKKIHMDTNWSDYYYTDLDAEVEITNLNEGCKIKYIPSSIKRLIGIEKKNELKRNLIEAILSSKLDSFLVIGEPGSGKTVSLHKLFDRLAKKCLKSKNTKATVPIYLNLKYLRLKEEEIAADKIHEWVTNQICTGQDRSVNEFVKHNFEKMFAEGQLFFLFDSFDEIPAIMDSDGNQNIVLKYSDAIYNFFNSATKCKGLVCSRPYRAPTGYMGQKIRILPLPTKKVKEALYRYLDQEHELAVKLWQELTQNYNLLDIIKNPFYLGLLTHYVTKHNSLPEKNYDLFDDFVNQRAEDDTDRLKSFNFTPKELVEAASNLAYSMIKAKTIGLNVRLDSINELISSTNESNRWSSKQIDNLIGALVYSKFGQLTDEDDVNSRSFSFAHRRFHEYFCASHLKQIHNYTPLSHYVNEDKWREVIVLLCEVIPSDKLDDLYQYSLHNLSLGIKAEIGTEKRKKAIETIQFLKDGFHGRIKDVPIELREKCSEFIQSQLDIANTLDQKKALEGVILVTDDSAQKIFGIALQNDSEWIKENVIKSCRILDRVPKQIGASLREYIYSMYEKTTIVNKYSSYDVYLSSHDALKQHHLYMKLLYSFAIIQIISYLVLFSYGIIFDPIIVVIILSSIIGFFIVPIPRSFKTQKRKFPLNKFSRYNFTFILSIITLEFVSTNSILLRGESILENSTLMTGVVVLSFLYISIDIIFKHLVNYWPHNINEVFEYIKKFIQTLPRQIYNLIQDIKVNFREILSASAAFTLVIAIVTPLIYLGSEGIRIFLNNPLDASIYIIYEEYNYIIASLIILEIVLMIIVAVVLILIQAGKSSISLISLSKDHLKIKRIQNNLQLQPSTFSNSMNTLNGLKTDYYKKQYINQLPKWITYDQNIDILIREAEKNNSGVKDELFKTVEYYEKRSPKA